MSDSLSTTVPFHPSKELSELVDKMIDDRLTIGERDRLESLLEDSNALDYCAERMRLHAELEETMTPVRVELTQKRHLILEKKGGLATVSRALTNVVKIDNPKYGKAVELPPELGAQRRVLSFVFVGVAVIVLLVAVLLLNRRDVSPAVPRPQPQLVFRNASFDDLEIAEKSPPYIYTILDWQDYFQGRTEVVCDVARYTAGAQSAKDGKYAVYLKKGFITQRLTRSDGSAFVAKKGVKVRVSGWVMLEHPGEAGSLSIATRVITSPYPAMQQVEPSVETVSVEKAEWQRFSVVLSLPEDSLVLRPQRQRSIVEGEPVDITGKNLAISIDNRSEVGVFLDAMTIEEVD